MRQKGDHDGYQVKLDDQLLKELAVLVRLDPDEATKERLIRDLRSMLGAFAVLAGFDQHGEADMASPVVDHKISPRDDVVCLDPDVDPSAAHREAVMRNAPDCLEGYYVVPRVVD